MTETEKNVCGTLFRAILILFSCVLIVCSMLCSVRVNAVNDRISSDEAQIQALSEQNDILLAKYESSISLDWVERYALEVLGMQRCTPGQIVHIELSASEGLG